MIKSPMYEIQPNEELIEIHPSGTAIYAIKPERDDGFLHLGATLRDGKVTIFRHLPEQRQEVLEMLYKEIEDDHAEQIKKVG